MFLKNMEFLFKIILFAAILEHLNFDLSIGLGFGKEPLVGARGQEFSPRKLLEIETQNNAFLGLFKRTLLLFTRD